MDKIKPLNIEPDVFLELASEDLLKLFNHIRREVAEKTGRINGVKIYKVVFDPRELDIIIEYMVSSEAGEISVKVIYSEKPFKTLLKYYRLQENRRK